MSTDVKRVPNNIVVTIRKEFDAPPLPYELHSGIDPQIWDFRFRQIHILYAQWSKPLLERIWLVVALLATFVLPTVLYGVVFNAVTPKPLRDALDRQISGDVPPSNRFDGNVDDAIGRYRLETRGIIAGVLFGVFLFFWMPLIVWKRLGTIRANAMTRHWEEEDRSRSTAFVPRWTITMPGIITPTGTVKISTPPVAPPSLFPPVAHVPPYLAKEANYNGYGYDYANGRSSEIVPAYFPGPDPAYKFVAGDEKGRAEFYEVKV
ncbi:hypothetical protein BS47DRAFT_752949 [Hydnum rufescens UP504]|uniref:Uncharacterized protein n=1 Tax=Hydnum rufescens UP504 TaxID=1448309 RepID=A0A9P6BA41_9AGAM|nr:hypothetical protein BS47DRAFT_752949 [Hydnum rufescens UP504]